MYDTTSTEHWLAKRDDAISEYSRGLCSPDLFRAKLYRLGYRGQAIEAEVRLHQPASLRFPRRATL